MISHKTHRGKVLQGPIELLKN